MLHRIITSIGTAIVVIAFFGNIINIKIDFVVIRFYLFITYTHVLPKLSCTNKILFPKLR